MAAVGGVLKDYDAGFFSVAAILTTDEGLQNMGLYPNGFDRYNVYLEGKIDREAEDLPVERLEAIASRSGDYTLYNMLEAHRKK